MEAERETGHSLGTGLAWLQTQHNIGRQEIWGAPGFWCTVLGSLIEEPLDFSCLAAEPAIQLLSKNFNITNGARRIPAINDAAVTFVSSSLLTHY